MARRPCRFKIKKQKNPTPERLYYEKMVELFRGDDSAIARFAKVRNAYEAMKPYARNGRNLRYKVDASVLEYFHDSFLMNVMKGRLLIGENKEERVYASEDTDFYRAFYSMKCAVGIEAEPISGSYKRCKGLVEEIIDLNESRGGEKTVKKEQKNIDKLLFTFTLRTAKKDGRLIPIYEILRRHLSRNFWLKENREKSLLTLCTEAWAEVYKEYPMSRPS